MKKIIHETITSTQIEARLQISSTPSPFVIMGHVQTGGYGKLGRTWESFKGNFSATFVVDLNVQHYDFSKIPMLVCIKLCKLLSTLTQSEGAFRIKWPNDIMLNKKKVCGILIEKIDNKFLFGLGINLRHSPDEERTSYPATNILHEVGVLIEPQEILSDLSQYFDCFETVFTECDVVQLRHTYMTLLEGQGRTIKVVTCKETFSGVLQNINHDGALILNIDGAEKLIYSADVFI